MRAIVIAMVVCLVVVLGAHFVGTAIDREMQDHILISGQNGETLDCERITDVQGRVFYDSCVIVP